ncbi:tRNA (guanine-N1)-methyltransferase [Ascidiimonas aurantiaca]|uniref:tRNA (guanine-N1)-methyltransferase n=1 Tax=Ascidiimonas aurantiaca TaxID=1685432 RepID=UPI0030EC9F63
MKKKLTLLSLFIGLLTWSLHAQNPITQELSLDGGTIDSQFEFLLKKSYNHKEYEVIKASWMARVRKNVSDTLLKSKALVSQLQTQIDNQQKEIGSLKTQLAEINGNLEQVNKEKESISFLGSLINKGVYKAVMWGLVIALFLLFISFVYKFRNSNIVTREARANLSDLEEEFEQHRRRALEREQKLSRQLQDELNKQKLMKK